jgi:hypothetical protein
MDWLCVVVIIIIIYYFYGDTIFKYNPKKRDGFRSPIDFLSLPNPISSYNLYPEPRRHIRPDYGIPPASYVVNYKDSNVPLKFAYNAPAKASYTPEGFQPRPEKITKDIVNDFMMGLDISSRELQYLPAQLNPLYLEMNNLSGNRGWLN